MATSAAKSIFARELLELRLSGALLAAFENWSRLAINAVMRDLEPDIRDALMRQSVLAAVPDELQDVVGEYFDDFQALADAVDVLKEVHQYAIAREMGEASTKRLLQTAVSLDRGVYAPIPQRMLEVTRVRELVPALIPQPPPYRVPEHPSLLTPDTPFAEYGNTYRTRLSTLGRTVSTSLSGRMARYEAQATGQDLRWVTMGDHRVRDSHRAAQGQTVAHDEWFRIGGTPMEYPGDPAAPTEETVNCRCVLTLVDPPERRFVQRYIPREWLEAAASHSPVGSFPSGSAGLTASAPNQARAPKGTPIGGQWIDTPGGMLDSISPSAAPGADLSVEIGGSVYQGTPAAPHGREAQIVDRGYTTPPLYHAKGDPESAQAFQNAIQAAKDANPYGASVYVYDLDDYQDMDLWLTADGTAGIALHGTDIVSGFNTGTNPDNKGFVQHAMATAQAAGGTRADAFDTVLPKLYAQAGMEVVGRVHWDDDYAPDGWDYDQFAKFNGGRPDVVFMKFNPDTWWGTYTPGQGQLVESYEDGQALTAAVQRHVDGLIVPFDTPRLSDLLRGRVGTQEPLHEVLAILLRPDAGHPDSLRDETGSNPSSTFAPTQARAPQGTPIGGQWIDTPNALLHDLGWAGESPDTPDQAYTVPVTSPPPWDPWMLQGAMNSHMPTAADYTPEQVSAIGNYTGQENVPMNTWLRDGKLNPAYPGSTPERVQSDIAIFDTTFTPIPGDTPVYRGLGNALDTDNLDGLVGSVIADKGYMSTSLNPFATTPFGGGIGASKPILHITVPKGTPVVWPGSMATVSGEMEVVLPHGTPLAIVGWHFDEKMQRNVVDAVVANPSSMTAAAAPAQARAPKGTPIGGQWIDTPSAILNTLGWSGESPETPDQAYDVPVVDPAVEIPMRMLEPMERKKMIDDEAARLAATQPAIEDTDQDIRFYTATGAMNLNTNLRAGARDPGDEEKIANLDAAIAQGTAPYDMYVYRAMPRKSLPHPSNPFEDEGNPQDLVGKVLADKAYLSTSIDSRGAGASSDTLMRIAVPKGHPILWAEPHSHNPGEYEVLLGRDTPLAITSIGEDPWGDPIYEAVISYPANPSLAAAASPTQARAPKGTPIGGEWIDTPGGLLQGLTGPAPVLEEDELVGLGEVDLDELPDDTGGGFDPAAAYGPPINPPRSYLETAQAFDEVNPGSAMVGGDVNCQRTATAFEMRARGYDVVAPPATGVDGSINNMEAMWENENGQYGTFSMLPRGTTKEAVWGLDGQPGNRFIVIGYDPVTGSGHAWNAEVLADGSVFEWDPQNKDEMHPSHWGISKINVLRVDNLNPGSAMNWDDGRGKPPWVMATKEFGVKYADQLGDW
jgi:hypothetical protein